jgi:8-oxo-dGTP pyrophosphatase MutT (NUDIX family)
MMNKERILLELKPIIRRLPIKPGGTWTKIAAVLLVIHFNNGIPQILLTKRSSNLRIHTGEVSFPGGKYCEGDVFLHNTAIRETNEETGLLFEQKDIVGSLPVVRTLRSTYVIYPFITVQKKIPEPKIFVEEVEKILDIPLIDMLGTMSIDRDLFTKESYKFQYQNEIIWGATARILKQLYNCLCINRK